MGNTYEVSIWLHNLQEGWKYETYWRGESAIVALYKAWKAKRSGIHCVKIEWRT
jgi:hypothetical protein